MILNNYFLSHPYKSFIGEQKQERELRQTGPFAQKQNLVLLVVVTVTAIPNAAQDSSVDLTTAKPSMKMLTD